MAFPRGVGHRYGRAVMRRWMTVRIGYFDALLGRPARLTANGPAVS